MPRAALLQMLKSAIAIGLTTILTATVEIMNRWGATGVLPDVAARRSSAVGRLLQRLRSGPSRHI